MARKLTKSQRGVNGVQIKSPKRGGSAKPYGKFSPVTKRGPQPLTANQMTAQDKRGSGGTAKEIQNLKAWAAKGDQSAIRSLKARGLAVPEKPKPLTPAQITKRQNEAAGLTSTAAAIRKKAQAEGADLFYDPNAGAETYREVDSPDNTWTIEEVEGEGEGFSKFNGPLVSGKHKVARQKETDKIMAKVEKEIAGTDLSTDEAIAKAKAGRGGSYPKKIGRTDPNSDSFSDAGPLGGDKETVAAVLQARLDMLENAAGQGSDVSLAVKQVHELEFEHGVKAGIPSLDDTPDYEAMSPKELLQVPANDGIHKIHPDAYAELEGRAADGDKAAQAVHPEYTGKPLQAPDVPGDLVAQIQKSDPYGDEIVKRSSSGKGNRYMPARKKRKGVVGIQGQKGVRTSTKSGLPTHGPKRKGARNSLVNGNWRRQARDPRTGKWI